MALNIFKINDENVYVGFCKKLEEDSPSSLPWFISLITEEISNPWKDCALYIKRNMLLYRLTEDPKSSRSRNFVSNKETTNIIDLRQCYLHIITSHHHHRHSYPTHPHYPYHYSTSNDNQPLTMRKNFGLIEIVSKDGKINWYFDTLNEENHNALVNLIREYVIGSKTHYAQSPHYNSSDFLSKNNSDVTERKELRFLLSNIPKEHIYLKKIILQMLNVLPYR